MNETISGRMTAKDKLHHLSRVPVFADLTDSQLAELAPLLNVRGYGADKIFDVRPARDGSVRFLFHGRVHLSHHTECGKKLVVAALGPGSFFGEKALFGGRDSNLLAEAITECVVGVVPGPTFLRFLEKHPVVAIRLMQSMTARMAKLEHSLVELAFKPVRARLAYFLLNTAEENGGREEVRGLTHRDLGDLVGTYRETVTSTLGELSTEGLISVGRKRIRLLDRRGLAIVAGEDGGVEGVAPKGFRD